MRGYRPLKTRIVWNLITPPTVNVTVNVTVIGNILSLLFPRTLNGLLWLATDLGAPATGWSVVRGER